MKHRAVILVAALGLGCLMGGVPQPASAQSPPAIEDVETSPIGSYRWRCRWQVQTEGTPALSFSVVSPISGLSAQCVNVDHRSVYEIWAAVPIDQLNQDLSAGYRVRSHSEQDCTGDIGAASEFACVPVPDIGGDLALFVGWMALAAKGALR